MHKKTVFLTVFLFLINSLDATVVLSDFDEINATHKLIDYTWKSQSVPRITVKKFPEKIKDVSNGKRLKFFIRTLLPMILMENETIEKEHDFIVKIAAKENWNKNDISIISEIAYKYRIIKKNSDLTGLSEIEKDESDRNRQHLNRAGEPADSYLRGTTFSAMLQKTTKKG